MKEETLAIGSRLLRLVTCLLCGHGMVFCGPSLGSLALCERPRVVRGMLLDHCICMATVTLWECAS